MDWNKASRGYALVVSLFLASGLSSLIYQVVWTRMLVLVFGSTTYATATVLAIFMGGLALGAWLAGRVADRLKNQLLWYGALEAFIGAWALVTPLLFDAATHLYQLIYPGAHSEFALFSLIRFVVAAIILLPPTTCMGASLPLLSKYVATSLDEVGSRTGTLYSINTFGAIIGAGLAGFVLLPVCGLRQTTLIAAAINFLLFLAIIPLVARNFSWNSSSGLMAPVHDQSESDSRPLTGKLKIAIACFAASGGVAMVYEVCWTRALLMMVGSSTYAFTIMLCSFLIGIFLGSLICAKLVDRVKHPLVLFSFLQVGVAVLAAAAMYEYMYLPYANLSLYLVAFQNSSWYLVAKTILCSALLVPFTLCLGATFPAIIKACTQDLAHVGRTTGDIYAANTIGAIIGAFLAGFVFIPMAGVEKSLVGAVAASAVIGLVAWLSCSWSSTAVKATACAAVAALVCVWLCLPKLWDPLIISFAQAYTRSVEITHAPKSYGDWWELMHRGLSLDYYKDGACSSVAVVNWGSAGHPMRSLVTNGHVDGSDSHDMTTQSLVAAFPLLLKPTADDVAVIGWGVGMSVGTATLFPVKSIEAIELEPSVVQASTLFHHVNYAPETNEKVHIQYNDGRNYLLATDRKFDVIISEPSNPWQSGVCNLFTSEYFQACRKRLKPGGIFSLWVQLTEVSPENVRGILKALKQTFPHTMVMALNSGNIAVLASESPLSFDPAQLQKDLNIEGVKGELAQYHLDSVLALLARIFITDDGVDRLISGATGNTDDRNFLEFSVARSYESQDFIKENAQMILDSESRPWQQVSLGQLSKQKQAEAAFLIANEEAKANSYLATRWVDWSLHLDPQPQAVLFAEAFDLPRETFAAVEQTCTASLAQQSDDIDALKTRGLARMALGKVADARSDFERALHKQPSDSTLNYFLGQTYSHGKPGLGDFAPPAVQGGMSTRESGVMMMTYFEPLLKDSKFVAQYPGVLLSGADALYRLGEYERALALMNQYRRLAPDTAASLRLLGNLCSNVGLRLEGASHLRKSFQMGQGEAAERLARIPTNADTDERLYRYASILQLDPHNARIIGDLRHLQDPKAKQLLSRIDSD